MLYKFTPPQALLFYCPQLDRYAIMPAGEDEHSFTHDTNCRCGPVVSDWNNIPDVIIHTPIYPPVF